MTSEFEKECLPEWCERCDKQGVYFVENNTVPYLVIHKRCGYEALSAWCPNCQTGFAFPNKPGSRILNWSCPTCSTNYPLAGAVFDNPINLYLEDELPDDVRLRVIPAQSKIPAGAIAAIIIVVFLVIGYILLR